MTRKLKDSQNQQLKIWGIRHHGPGSALRVRKALSEWKPDIVLLEAPSDAQSLMDFFNPYEIKPPVAGLIYDPKNFERAAYFPLAEFSPEWCVLQYVFNEKIPIRFIDLPMGAVMKNKLGRSRRSLNPFAVLAEASEFKDVEQWWDHYLESASDDTRIFKDISTLIREVRNGVEESQDTRLREWYMASQVEKAKDAGFAKIAVICGAYHVPFLEDYDRGESKWQKKVDKLKVQKTEALWVPWSYARMDRESGYGAGIAFPSWYESLFKYGHDAAAHWLSKSMRVIRSEKVLSAAHVLEGVRLARALRDIRGKKSLGVPEMEDVVTAVFYEGSEEWKEIHGVEIFTGKVRGVVPEDLFTVPLQKDFRQRLKSARLSKLFKDHSPISKTLDLRNTKHLELSRFLFCTRVLEIPLAMVVERSNSSYGNFKETWDLEWDPVSEWALIQAGTFGTTIYSAASAKLLESIQETEDMSDLISLLDESFLCGFEPLFDIIYNKLVKIYIVTDSIFPLLSCINSLLFINEYGSIRWKESPDVSSLLDRMVSKVAYQIPDVVFSVSEDEKEKLKSLLESVSFGVAGVRYLHLRKTLAEAWLEILTHSNVTDYFSGKALRVCMDDSGLRRNEVERHFLYHLTRATPEETVDWLQGLFSGGILWLLFDDIFLSQLNTWLSNMEVKSFKENLPMLRKIFSQSPSRDREMLFRKVKGEEENLEFSEPIAEVGKNLHFQVTQLIEKYGLEQKVK